VWNTGDGATTATPFSALDDDLTYTANQFDRDVVSESQIRLVLRTFRDRLFSEIFPSRADVSKWQQNLTVRRRKVLSTDLLPRLARRWRGLAD